MAVTAASFILSSGEKKTTERPNQHMWPDHSHAHHSFKYFPFHVNVNLSSQLNAEVDMETSSSHKKEKIALQCLPNILKYITFPAYNNIIFQMTVYLGITFPQTLKPLAKILHLGIFSEYCRECKLWDLKLTKTLNAHLANARHLFAHSTALY